MSYLAAFALLTHQQYILKLIMNGLGISIQSVSVPMSYVQCSTIYPYRCFNATITVTEPVLNVDAASIAFGRLANAIVQSMVQLYVTEVVLTSTPFISPIGYYLSDVSRYFIWQAEWALVNAYALYYMSKISEYASPLAAVGSSLLPIRQVRWVGGVLFAIGLVTPMYAASMANWVLAQGLANAIRPTLANDIKGILSLGTNLFSLGSRLEEFNVVSEFSMALYSVVVYGVSRVLGEVGVHVEP